MYRKLCGHQRRNRWVRKTSPVPEFDAQTVQPTAILTTLSQPKVVLDTDSNYSLQYIFNARRFDYTVLFSVSQSPSRAKAATLLRFLDHTQTHTQTVGLLWTSDQIVAKVATYTTRNIHNRWTSTWWAQFEPAISGIKGRQTYALDCTAVGMNCLHCAVGQNHHTERFASTCHSYSKYCE